MEKYAAIICTNCSARTQALEKLFNNLVVFSPLNLISLALEISQHPELSAAASLILDLLSPKSQITATSFIPEMPENNN
jgi:hypothetical protein